MGTPHLLQTTLSDAELDELQRFLESRCMPHGGMDVSTLDGYLTAIVSGPEPIAPSEWLPQVWTEDSEDAGIFESDEEADRLATLIFRRMNEIVRDLEQGAIEPIFFEAPDEDEARSDFADAWCVGYLEGIKLRADAWEPLVARTDDDAPLTPILALAETLLDPDRDDEEAIDEAIDDEERDEVAALVPQAAYEAYAYWRKQA